MFKPTGFIISVSLFIGIAMPLANTQTEAALLGITIDPLIGNYDSDGITRYDASTDQFLVDATVLPNFGTPVTGLFLASNVEPNLPDFRITIEVDNTGNLVDGNPFGSDFLVRGEFTDDPTDLTFTPITPGPVDLITGEITAFGWTQVGLTGVFEFTFDNIGGWLINNGFITAEAIGVTLVSIAKDNAAPFNSDFNIDFGGGAEGSFGIIDQPNPAPDIPEPHAAFYLVIMGAVFSMNRYAARNS